MRWIVLIAMVPFVSVVRAEEKTETFDRDPNWDSHNNRSNDHPPRRVIQKFGYSPTKHSGIATPGELGGIFTPDGASAYYARKISSATFDDKLTASGRMAYTNGQLHLLIGFFNSETLNEWRTPNTIAIRILARANRILVYVEYCTSRWRAGGDSPGGFATEIDPKTKRKNLVGFEGKDKTHSWSITYDPKANDGNGSISVTFDNEKSVCNLTAEHRRDGAKFDRFGVMPVMKHADDGGECWLGDIAINGIKDDFSKDPKWDAKGNDRDYMSYDRRPRFNFGYSETNFAGGNKSGELGGLIFSGDIRYPSRMAYYADKLEPLALDKPLHASGKLSLHRGTTDSGVMLGFFHSKESIRTNPAQDTSIPNSFLGLYVTGPSRQGFFASPVYRTLNGERGSVKGDDQPHVYPDRAVHQWQLDYEPEGRKGKLKLKVNEKTVAIEVSEKDRDAKTIFDRFGIVTTWIDGNGQKIYFDDLKYTVSQK